MVDSLIGRSELPPVSILQMILEGPKGYFGRRGQMEDTQWLQQQQQQQQGAFAQNLIKTPEWNQAMGSPYDRQAQGGLWALTQGGPGTIPTQGGNWLQSVIAGSYGREQATFEDALQKSRIKMTTDEALRLEQGKIDIANNQLKEQMKLFMPDPQGGPSPAQSQGMNNIKYDLLAHNLGLAARPEGYSWNPQNAMMEPTYGGPVWQKMTDELDPLQAINGAVDQLMDLDKAGSTDVGTRRSLIAQVKDQIRLASKGGAMDKDMQAALEEQISSYSSVTSYGNMNPVDSISYATAQEKLRALKYKTGNQIVAWRRKYMVDPKGLGDPFAFTRPADKVPKPTGTADEAVKKLQPPPSAPQPAPSSKVNRGPLPAGAPSVWETGPGQDTGMKSRGRGGK